MRPYWLPHPVLSLVLTAGWLLLTNGFSAGQLLLGAALGIALPWLTSPFWPERVSIARPGLLLRFVMMVLGDIITANLTVARQILAPSTARPSFIIVPLTLEDPFAITALASTISLTPGTVSAEVDRDRRILLVHALDVDDEAALANHIKARYERPLQEIFSCSQPSSPSP